MEQSDLRFILTTPPYGVILGPPSAGLFELVRSIRFDSPVNRFRFTEHALSPLSRHLHRCYSRKPWSAAGDRCVSDEARGLLDIRPFDHRFRLTEHESYEEEAMKPAVERRKHPRYLGRFPSIFSTDRVQIAEGLVRDLSLGGCRVTSTMHVPSGTPIKLHFQPDPHSPIYIYIPSAVVCWEGDPVFGLTFKELSKLELASLTRLLWTLRP